MGHRPRLLSRSQANIEFRSTEFFSREHSAYFFAQSRSLARIAAKPCADVMHACRYGNAQEATRTDPVR